MKMLRIAWPAALALAILITVNPIKVLTPEFVAIAQIIPPIPIPPVVAAVSVELSLTLNRQLQIIFDLTGWTNCPATSLTNLVVRVPTTTDQFTSSVIWNPYAVQSSGVLNGIFTNTMTLRFASGLSENMTGTPVLTCQRTTIDGQIWGQTVPNNGGVIYFASNGWTNYNDPRVRFRPHDTSAGSESPAQFYRVVQEAL
jgi:hypothetical protein